MTGRLDQPLVSIVVPAYNEVQRIAQTLRDIQSYLDGQGHTYEIIVSADGDDGTREVVAAMAKSDPRVRVIGSAERGGKGKGVRQGVMLARGRYIGNVDADYKTPIDQIERVLPHLHEGWDLVIGSRRMDGAEISKHQPLYRRLGSKAFALVMRTLIGLHAIQDTQCGFKFFRRDVARDLFTRQKIDGYMFDVEILRLATLLGYSIKEVGVRWADDGDTRYDPIGGTYKNAKELLRIRRLCRQAMREQAEIASTGSARSTFDVEPVEEEAAAPVGGRLVAQS